LLKWKSISEFENKIFLCDYSKLIDKIPDKSIDAIITDPPYGINYLSNYYKDGNPFDSISNDNREFKVDIDKLWNKLKDTGSMFIFFSYKFPLIDDRIKNVIIWVKNNWSAGDLTGDFGNQYESIAFLPRKNFKLKSYKRYSNVWKFNRVIPIYHPTEKPLNLMRRLIEVSTFENEIVFDPFIGGGSTLIACKQLNRKYIGSEIKEKYFDIVNKRLKKISVNLNRYW